MKKIIFTCLAVIFALYWANSVQAQDCPGCDALTNDINVSVGNENYTFVATGGEGSNRQFVSTHLYPNYPGYGPISSEYNKWIPYRADLVVDPAMLLSKGELDQWLPYFKYGKLFKLPGSYGPQKMFRMVYGRQNPEDVIIADPVLAADDSGDPSFTERVLLSFAWHYLNARRFATEIFISWEPHAGGIALPSGGGYSKITAGDEAISASVAPMMGKSWTKIKMPYKMRLKVYNDGQVWLYDPSAMPAQAQAATPLPARTATSADIPVEPLSSVYFDTDKSDIRPDQREKIAKVAEYLAANKDSLRQSGHKLLILATCDVRHDTPYNDVLGANRAENTYRAVLAALENMGISAAEATEYLIFSTSGKRTAKTLNHDDRRADVYRVQRVSETTERNTAK